MNDPMATEFLSQVVTDQFGADSVLFSDQSWGGDTFAWYWACARFVRKARGSRSGIDRTS